LRLRTLPEIKNDCKITAFFSNKQEKRQKNLFISKKSSNFAVDFGFFPHYAHEKERV